MLQRSSAQAADLLLEWGLLLELLYASSDHHPTKLGAKECGIGVDQSSGGANANAHFEVLSNLDRKGGLEPGGLNVERVRALLCGDGCLAR